MHKPYEWQDKAFTRFLKELAFMLNAHCGTGKTLAATRIAIGKMLPTIVIAPGHALCNQWKEALIENGVDERDIWVYKKTEETKQGAEYARRFDEWLLDHRYEKKLGGAA